MKVDLTITISVILAIAAIISPVLTALLNNRHQYKMHKLDLEHQEKQDRLRHYRQTYTDYLAGAGKIVYYADKDGLHDYGKAYLNALLISSPAIRPRMIRANSLIMEDRFEQAIPILEETAEQIKQEDSAGIL